jgi:L-gulonate 3-dehydrogenase
VALVGAGTIGGSWAVVYTRAGLETHVFDIDESQLSGIRDRFDRDVALLVDSGLLEVDAVASMRERLVVDADLRSAVEAADYVQESVPESLELKRAVFAELDRLAAEDVVIGSSVSAIPVTEIAGAARRAERCVGVHPTNPPHIVPLVEIVPGEKTDPEVAEWAYAFMERVGQKPILCRKEIYGFVLNRIQMALLREALYLYRNGVASAADIDRCVQQGLGLRWAFLGPFGIEHTNAASIADDLHKFGQALEELFAEVCQPYDSPSEEEIASLAADVEEMFGDRPQPEIVEYRNRMVLAVRSLKQEPNPYVFDH